MEVSELNSVAQPVAVLSGGGTSFGPLTFFRTRVNNRNYRLPERTLLGIRADSCYLVEKLLAMTLTI